MAENDFLAFAAAADSNVLDQATYAAASATATGFVAGVASSAAVNKTLRQSSIMAAVIASFIAQQTGADVIDDGTLATILANLTTAVSGRLINVQMFTSSGTYTSTAGAKSIIVEGCGGAGSGGACAATGSTTCAAAAGGGAGAYAKARFTSGFTGGITVTIGAGGAAPAAGNNNGNVGGTTSFGSLLSLPGGSAGLGSPAFTPPLGGGSNGQNSASPTVTGGTALIALPGMAGGNGMAFAASTPQAGAGGSNPLGTGAWAPTGNGARQGGGHGCGSSGANAQSSSAAQAGLAGGSGVIIVYEYA